MRKLKRRNWEEDKILLFLLLSQSAIFLLTIIVNSAYRPSFYPTILIESIINLAIFILTFFEALYRKRSLAVFASMLIFIMFLLSWIP
ncbi:MAG: hypothetical protein ABDH32_07600 [Candidatus Caldarchaeales archaeon]